MGGCTSCHAKTGCDHRKGSMMEAVDTALARLYPTRTWGAPHDAGGGGAAGDAAALADELAGELDGAVFVRPGGPDEHCDFLYVLCVGRPPCAVQVRDADVAPPAEWHGARLDEHYLRIALSSLTRMAVIQEVSIAVDGDADGWTIHERTRAGVYSAPLLKRFQRAVAILPAYDILHVDLGEIAAPPPGFDPGEWPALYAGTPAIANYLFHPQPLTMTATTWLPRDREEAA